MIEDIIKKLKKHNLQDYEIFYSENKTTSIDTDKTNFDKKEYDYDKGYGLRIFKDNKLGFVYFSDPKNIDSSIKTALKVLKIRPKLKDFQFHNKNPKMKVKAYDKKVIDLSEDKIQELIKGMLDNIKHTPINCSITKNVSDIRILNSEGLDCSQTETSLIASSYCSKKGQTGSEYYESYKLNIKDILKTGKIASKRANQKSKRISSCKLPIILQGDALSEIIDSLFLTQITGDKKHFKSSYLIGKENKQIASDKLTLYEDPFCEAYSKTNFDGEGVEDDISILIDKGKFTGFVYNKETAALDKVKTFGFCSRGSYKSFPDIGFSNILIKPGKTKNLEEIYKKYIVIDDLFGFHTANATTGDFSLTIGNGYIVDKTKKLHKQQTQKGKQGENKQYIQGNILSGNTYALLKNISNIEKKTEIKGSFILPRILVKGLTLS